MEPPNVACVHFKITLVREWNISKKDRTEDIQIAYDTFNVEGASGDKT